MGIEWESNELGVRRLLLLKVDDFSGSSLCLCEFAGGELTYNILSL